MTKYFGKRYLSRGRLPKNRVRILNAILFGYMVDVRSSRALARACQNDIRFMWLMEGMNPPSHTLITTVITELNEDLRNIFHDVNARIAECETIDRDVLHIDGTKIEADANRYTFVWKKAVRKHRRKLFQKVTTCVPEINHILVAAGEKSVKEQQSYAASTLTRMVAKIAGIIAREGIVLVYGKGRRKTPQQRTYDKIKQYRDKLAEYEEHLAIIGEERGSYAKTDHDATFMRMKEDHMRNSQLKAGYNVQIGVSDGYILLIGAYQHRSDQRTFQPFLESYHSLYGVYPAYPVADAGYGGYDNYHYCLEKGMGLYQKYNTWEMERTRAYKNNPFNRINFPRDKKGNYICPQNRKLTYRYSKTSSYIKSPHEIKVYESVTCKRCKRKKRCTQSKDARKIAVNETLDDMRRTVRENLESPFGIELRIQRSIQVEGAFGVIKQDMAFRRFSRTELQGVRNELHLIAIGYNLKKFHNNKQRLLQ